MTARGHFGPLQVKILHFVPEISNTFIPEIQNSEFSSNTRNCYTISLKETKGKAVN